MWGLAIVLYVLFFGEVFLRIFSPVPMLPRYVCATDFGIRGNLPNASYWHTTAEYKINIRTNSKGIRSDREIPYEKPAGVKRIVVLGDSFGMGYEVDLPDTFLFHMEQGLLHAGKKVEVVNLSVSGHGNAEELIMLQHEGIKYSPDLILLAWQETDLEDNVRSDLFGIQSGKLVPRSKVYLPAVEVREKLDKYPIYRWLESESNMYCWIRESAAKWTKNVLVALKSKNFNKKKKVESAKTTAQNNYVPDLAFLLVSEIKTESLAMNANLLVLDIPQSHPTLGGISLMPKAISDPQNGFHVVSVLPEFGKYHHERLYWDKSHWHFTPRANGIVGRALARYILDHHLL